MKGRAPGTVLLLVDLQNDFLERPGLVPDRETLCARVAALLAGVRARGIPVAHAQTITSADGADRMPHWQRANLWQCVEGTSGALAPPVLAPLAGEPILRKRFFSAFGDARLEAWLRAHAAERLLVSGVYLHGCVRATVLDAYERGYEVCVVDDAVGTTEPLHAELTRAYLSARAAAFRTVAEIVAELGGAAAAVSVARAEPGSAAPALPAALIAGARRAAATPTRFIHRNPCRSADVVVAVPLGGAAEVEEAARACDDARADWARVDAAARADLLERWARELESRRGFFRDLIVREVAKPRRFVDEEIGRAVAHVRGAAALVRDPSQSMLPVAPGVHAAQRPLGVVGLVTPWNNPLAIVVGKIAPALAFGNAVVLKPAPQASLTALAILESLDRAGLHPGIVNAVFGAAQAARAVCREARVAAVSVTGSLATGRALAAHCAEALKPLQAELGGNNAAIVLADADLDVVVPGLVRAAFAFAGQRCTAIRRYVVERAVVVRFEALARAAIAGLANGEPNDPATEVGPLISAEKRDRVMASVERAASEGARLVAGGCVPRDLAHGAWLAPTLLADAAPESRIVQEETFGPVAIIQVAHDLDDALALANGVAQGLVLNVCTGSARARAYVLDAAQAGIVQLAAGPLAVHPLAPFSGWKASGLGPPEHGVWDAGFYARTQAVYADESYRVDS